jgi:NAD(P)-dependent dehydrogenase (short-subunit alcohol dehydrogenase family)
MSRLVEANEPYTIGYQFYLNRAETKCLVHETYTNSEAVLAHISSVASWPSKLYGIVKDQKGHIDILFVNAGIMQFAPLVKISEEDFDINVKGVLFTVQKALSILKDGSSIILNAFFRSQCSVERTARNRTLQYSSF